MERARETGHFCQLAAGLSAALIAVVTGSCFAWATTTLLTLLGPNSPVPMTYSQASWMIAFILLGNLVTPIPAGVLADIYGRKPLILATGPIYILSWAIIYKAQTITLLCVARVLQGFSVGIVYTVVPMYLGEIPSPMFRGTITSIFQSALYLGFVYEYCIGPFVTYRTLAVLSGLLPVIFMICFLSQPETPFFLVMQGKEKEAAKSLMYLRGKRSVEEINEELDTIIESVTREMSNQASWKDVIATPTDRHALLVVNVVGAVKILGGSVAIPTYCTQLFSQTGFDMVSPNTLTIVMGLLVFASSFFSTALTDIAGRRPLLLISSIGCAFSLLSIGMFFFLKDVLLLNVQSFNWLCPLALIFYCLFLAFGLDPVSITYRSEMFPSNTRAAAASINAIIITVGGFLSLKFYQVIAQEVGIYALYFGFAFICFGGALWMYFIAIETKGRTLSDIQGDLLRNIEMQKKQGEFKEMDEGIYKTVHI